LKHVIAVVVGGVLGAIALVVAGYLTEESTTVTVAGAVGVVVGLGVGEALGGRILDRRTPPE
jgi:hypothetical protein